MAELTPQLIRQLVAATQGVDLDNVSALRVAMAAAQAFSTLDARAGHSLFDTEPARFETTLADFAEEPKSDD